MDVLESPARALVGRDDDGERVDEVCCGGRREVSNGDRRGWRGAEGRTCSRRVQLGEDVAREGVCAEEEDAATSRRPCCCWRSGRGREAAALVRVCAGGAGLSAQPGRSSRSEHGARDEREERAVADQGRRGERERLIVLLVLVLSHKAAHDGVPGHAPPATPSWLARRVVRPPLSLSLVVHPGPSSSTSPRADPPLPAPRQGWRSRPHPLCR